jgi:hypothetical protein
MIRISALRRTGLVLAALLAAQPALAQSNPAPVPPPSPFATVRPQTPAPTIANPQSDHPAYLDLIAAIESTVDMDALLTNGLGAVKRQFQADPNLAAAESESPGLIDEIIAGMRPVVEKHNARVSAVYRPRMAALTADYLTPEEAASVAAFYRSDLGRKLMGGVFANYDMDKTVATAMQDKPVTEAEVQADILSAVGKGMQTMDAKDMVAMAKMSQENPALLKLAVIGPPMQRLRTQMENEPLLPEDDAAILKVVETVFAKRFPQ